MSIFEALASNNPQIDINALYQQFQLNPVEFLVRSRLNIPQGLTNPQQIVQHLATSGQIPPQYQRQVDAMLKR